MFGKLMTLLKKKYPQLWKKVWLYATAFLSFYFVESGFSHVCNLQSKAHNNLNIVKSKITSLYNVGSEYCETSRAVSISRLTLNKVAFFIFFFFL